MLHTHLLPVLSRELVMFLCTSRMDLHSMHASVSCNTLVWRFLFHLPHHRHRCELVTRNRDPPHAASLPCVNVARRRQHKRALTYKQKFFAEPSVMAGQLDAGAAQTASVEGEPGLFGCVFNRQCWVQSVLHARSIAREEESIVSGAAKATLVEGNPRLLGREVESPNYNQSCQPEVKKTEA